MEAGRRVHLPGRVAVIEYLPGLPAFHFDLTPDMAQPVELCPDLADLGRQELLVADQPVRAGRRALGRKHHRVAAASEQWHALLIQLVQLVDLSLGNQPHGVQHFPGRNAVGGTGLIVGPPFRVRPPGAGLPVLGESCVG